MEGSNHSCSHKATDPITLKESTKQLLNLVDELQSNKEPNNIKNCDASFLNNFEYDDEYDDNCTVYERLSGKCRCVNRTTYNDIMIYFNEGSTKHKSSTMGNIVRNMKILKRVLYLGGKYTMHTLSFLNEGTTMSTTTEKKKIADACGYADICNLFEEHSIVKYCLPWKTNNYNNFNNQHYVLQALAANFIQHLVLLPSGKYYLTLSSRMFDELSKTIRKSGSKMETGTLDVLRRIQQDLILPSGRDSTNILRVSDSINYKYGIGNQIVNRLRKCHKKMTKSEIVSHLEILRNLSYSEFNKKELREELDNLLQLFHELICYDLSDINNVVSNIMDNVLPQNYNMENLNTSNSKECQADMEKSIIKHSKIEFHKIPTVIAPAKIRNTYNPGSLKSPSIKNI